jgi:hypothetical protein
VSEALMISAEQKKRARNVGYGYLGLAVITLVSFRADQVMRVSG